MRADHRNDKTPRIVESVLEYTGNVDFMTPLPRPKPRLLNLDESVPGLHHAVISSAIAQLEAAQAAIEGVRSLYPLGDVRVRELSQIVRRLRLCRFEGDSWLVWHPAK